MKKLLVLDERNYDVTLDEIIRISARGIIFVDNKLLMVEDFCGGVKLPGGGIEAGEDDRKALIREVKEETGYDVISKSIRAFGEIVEKRLSFHEPKIWHHISRLYFCDVYINKGKCSYTENEKKLGFRQVFLTIDEALQKNKKIIDVPKGNSWNKREFETLLLIKRKLTLK